MRGGARRQRARRTSCTLSALPRAPTKQPDPFQQPASVDRPPCWRYLSAVQPGSWAALRRPPHVYSAVVVVLSILGPAFSTFITATVLPTAIAEIGGLAIYAWASTAYAVGSILGSAGSSVAVLRVGTRRAVALAVAVFVAGAAVCALAPTMPAVVVGRALQGLGGGMLIASAHSMVRELFPAPLWQRMLRTISCAWAIPGLGGPVVGGVLAAA